MTDQTKLSVPLVNLFIDGQAIAVPKGTTVFQAAKKIGIQLPIFCYQDRMPPFGACRVCLVEVEKMGKLQTSCSLEATEGMVVNTQSHMALQGRESILELLLINHPLDCPVCDKGGECPLQENALEHGPGESRFFEEKRHFTKPYSLGPVLMLDRERCIACARCTRFGDVIAGDHALELIDRGYKTEVGTLDGQPVDSKFIGNTIMICPVGALTSQVYRFRARPWDNDSTHSTCTLCPVGCSMILDSRDGEIMRTRSQENLEVNDIWMCDKGWFGYEFSSNANRLKSPLIRDEDGKLIEATWEQALSVIVEHVQTIKSLGKLAGMGGAPLTVEENYLFQKLMRQCLGVNHLDYRVGTPIQNIHDEGVGPGMVISLKECEELSTILIFGADLTEEFPVIWLRLKQAINKGAKVIFLGHYAPETSRYFTRSILHAPGKELETLSSEKASLQQVLASSPRTAIFLGSQYLFSQDRRSILSEILKLRGVNSHISINLLEGRGNSMGARYAGNHPELSPFGKQQIAGLNTHQILEQAATQGWDFLYVVGANPAANIPSSLWSQARSRLKFLLVQDLFLTETALEADVVLPTLSYVEKGGSFINIEGRVQKLLPGKEIPEGMFSDGDIFMQIAQKMGTHLTIDREFLKSLAVNQIVPLSQPLELESHPRTPMTQPKLAATFIHPLFDNGVRMSHNEHLIQLTKQPVIRINPADAKQLFFEQNEKVTLSINGQTLIGKLKIDKKVALGSVVLPVGLKEFPIQNLNFNLLNGLEVNISKSNLSMS